MNLTIFSFQHYNCFGTVAAPRPTGAPRRRTPYGLPLRGAPSGGRARATRSALIRLQFFYKGAGRVLGVWSHMKGFFGNCNCLTCFENMKSFSELKTYDFVF